MPDILVIDIGNSAVKFGLAHCGAGRPRIRARGSVVSGATASAAERALRRVVGTRRPAGAVLCSVVPRETGTWNRLARRACGVEPVVVSRHLNLGIGISYPKPGTIGADRLANACAAAELFGCPVVVLDFGTALTFDVLSARREYAGGVIAPGPALFTDYLAERTALLPRIAWGASRRAIGRSTVEAMTVGADMGYRGLVREILGQILSELGGARRVRLCATGGHAARAVRGLPWRIRVMPDLTLVGLGMIWQLNSGKK